eukprot:PITA_20497
MDFQIHMGNKGKCTPGERGTIEIKRVSGASTSVTDVLHVPSLGMNLISVSQLHDKGYNVYFVRKKVFIKHQSWKKVKQIGVHNNSLNKLQINSPKALVSSNNRDSSRRGRDLNELWHRRMRYLHHGALTKLSEAVTGVPELSREHDDVCLLGKYAKAAFPRSDSRSNGKQIKVLRSDIGGEYTGSDFTNFYVKGGIRRELTAPYNPQHNGIAEQKNKSIDGATKAMLHN